VEILLPQRAIGPVGEAHFGDLLRAESQIRILKLDQYRIAGEHLQQAKERVNAAHSTSKPWPERRRR
jgi:hypothetical protein